MIFTQLQGDDLGCFHNENYRLVSCMDGHIVFSYAQKGEAMTAHLASDKIGLRYVKPAINSFCKWIFANYGVKFIYAVINKKRSSVMRIVKKCGFSHLASDANSNIYSRARQWAV